MKFSLLLATLAVSALLAACGKVTDPATSTVPRSPSVRLDARAPASCLAFPSDDSLARLERAYPALEFAEPTQLVFHPSAPYAYVVEQGGRVLRFSEDDAATTTEVVLDLTDQLDVTTWEMGLLGFAMRPDYDEHPEAFVKYTTRNDAGEPVLRVVRVQGDATGRHFDLESADMLFDLPNPEGYHHGGPPMFGPDGKLYIPFGDGGFGSSEIAQDYANVRGSILRIDVDARPYGIPFDNPFAADPLAASELFATGFRNPFGFSFDPNDRSLWVGDVGEAAYEELDHVQAGDNLGWPAFEGFACRQPERCANGAYVAPVLAYGHEEGLTIVGGPVYQGQELPASRGHVLFADFYTGQLRTYEPSTQRTLTLTEGGSNPVAFAEDRSHEILVVDRGGMLFRLRASLGTSHAPLRLSETGCVDATDPTRFAAGLVPYSLNAPLWSDGAEKDRVFGLPGDSMITVADDGSFVMPTGSVVLKTFAREGRPLETRVLANHEGIGWRGYTYAWREDGSDADLLETGEVKTIHGETWQFPSRGQCFTCHAQGIGILGLQRRQLDRDVRYPGEEHDSPQLETLRENGLLDDFGANESSFYAPSGEVDPAAWSRAYLDVNCSSCHRPQGPGGAGFDLRLEADSEAFCNLPVTIYVPGMPDDSMIVAPGAPERSALLMRMESTDPQRRMPPLASHLVDSTAVDMIRRWIVGMQHCE